MSVDQARRQARVLPVPGLRASTAGNRMPVESRAVWPGLPAIDRGGWLEGLWLPQPSFTAVPEAVTMSIEPPWPTVS
jgi:hypothetical protein